MERLMHQTRKTHNAHNETQRRLKKVLSNGYVSTYHRTPHYTYVEYRHGKLWLIHPDWANTRISEHAVTSGPKNGRVFDSFEDAEFAKKHQFLAKKSKSNGSKSYYKYAKRMVHKWWRRKRFGDVTYSLKGSYSSWVEINW